MTTEGIFKTQTVARLTGFSPSVLRTWETRYDILQPERTAQGHRLYTQEDLAVLRSVRKLLDDGLQIGEVATLGRDRLLEGHQLLTPVDDQPAEPAHGLGARVEGLVATAQRLSSPGLQHQLDLAFQTWSAEFVVTEILVPAWKRLERDKKTQPLAYRLGREIFRFRLMGLLWASVSLRTTSPRALCAAFPGDHEEIPVLAAAYLLARHGWRAEYLGPNLALSELGRAVEETVPDLVYLGVSRPGLFQLHHHSLQRLVGDWVEPPEVWLAGVEADLKEPLVGVASTLDHERLKQRILARRGGGSSGLSAGGLDRRRSFLDPP